jgi:hypothetical protein
MLTTAPQILAALRGGQKISTVETGYPYVENAGTPVDQYVLRALVGMALVIKVYNAARACIEWVLCAELD